MTFMQLKRVFLLIIISPVFISCSHIHLNKLKPLQIYRIGILPFDFSAPLTDPEDFMNKESIPKDLDHKTIVESEKAKITQLARNHLVEKLNVHQSLEIILLENQINTKSFKENEIAQKLATMATDKNLDAILFVGIPWYGKTNIIYPIVGLTADIAIETLIIGMITKWNPTIIWANVGLELITNTPLWFGGSYLFGASMRPVELDVKLWTKEAPEKIRSDDIEIFISRKILKEYPEEERKKKNIQLEASLKKALKELSEELTSD